MGLYQHLSKTMLVAEKAGSQSVLEIVVASPSPPSGVPFAGPLARSPSLSLHRRFLLPTPRVLLCSVLAFYMCSTMCNSPLFSHRRIRKTDCFTPSPLLFWCSLLPEIPLFFDWLQPHTPRPHSFFYAS